LYETTREVVSVPFPYSRMRKQQGNWLSYTVASTITVNHATMVTTLLLKQLICLFDQSCMDGYTEGKNSNVHVLCRSINS